MKEKIIFIVYVLLLLAVSFNKVYTVSAQALTANKSDNNIKNGYDYPLSMQYEFVYNIVDLDEEKPVINYKKTLYTTVGNKINLTKKVTVTDNSGETIVPTVEGEYSFDTVGKYSLKYVAVDSSNNKTEKPFTLVVNEKVVTTAPAQTEQQTYVAPPQDGSMRQRMIAIAKSQVGNYNGNPYWSWYGFKSRVEWCATFVSWVANQAGALNTYIPKFAGVGTGYKWFKDRGQIRCKSYVPTTGDIIFFTWSSSDRLSHVGLVEKVENGRVYVIEGNTSNNKCENTSYPLDHSHIVAYAVPAY